MEARRLALVMVRSVLIGDGHREDDSLESRRRLLVEVCRQVSHILEPDDAETRTSHLLSAPPALQSVITSTLEDHLLADPQAPATTQALSPASALPTLSPPRKKKQAFQPHPPLHAPLPHRRPTRTHSRVAQRRERYVSDEDKAKAFAIQFGDMPHDKPKGRHE
jgi:hypothetical protein